jgi:DNA-directed RNA polymerase subunit RPC12/RpoP
MGIVLKDYECDTCYKHSYEVKEIDGMKVCPYCGEEPDFLDK